MSRRRKGKVVFLHLAVRYPFAGVVALLREVELLAEAIGSMAAIKVVTATAARDLRQQDNLGTLAPGRYADMLVVDADPIRDVRELRRFLLKGGGGKNHEVFLH